MSETTACSACAPEGCHKMGGAMILKKLQNMLNDNYTMLIVMIVLLSLLGLALWYFINSLKNTLVNYYKNKKVLDVASNSIGDISNNQHDTKADNEIYYETPSEDPNKKDPSTFIPKEKQEFIKKVETDYKDINDYKTKYISDTYDKDNDDVIDAKILYPDAKVVHIDF